MTAEVTATVSPEWFRERAELAERRAAASVVGPSVDFHRDGDPGMAEDLHRVPGRYAEVLKQGGRGPPQAMKRDPAQVMRRDDAMEGPREIPWFDRVTGARGENQVVGGPLMPRGAEDLQLGMLE